MGLILDSSELIWAERNGRSIDEVRSLYKEDDPYLSVVTLAEFQHGIRRAETALRREARRSFLSQAIAQFAVLPISPGIALLAGDLDAELQLRGEKIAFADILIAATAIHHEHPLCTRNLKHFERVPALRVMPSRWT